MEKVEEVNEVRYYLWVVNFHVNCVYCKKLVSLMCMNQLTYLVIVENGFLLADICFD